MIELHEMAFNNLAVSLSLYHADGNSKSCEHEFPFDYRLSRPIGICHNCRNGNCIYVEAGGVRSLFDAGISGTQSKIG